MSTPNEFKSLLSPGRIGTMELPNRVVMAPMGMEIVEADGVVRQPTIDYYVERARGGVGLLISENTAAAYPFGANSAHEIAMSSDIYLPGLTQLAEEVHAAGGKMAIQLAHHGKVGRLDTMEGREIVMPSHPRAHGATRPPDMTREEMGLMAKAAGGAPPRVREATAEDIAALVEAFADAADRAKRAGFDGVEIHGAHGYIFSEFLSEAWNFREDEYGGSAENRARLLCEVVAAAKERTGGDFPIWCRIDAKEFRTEGGITLEQACVTARLVEAAGADAVHVSAYSDPIGAGFTEGPLVHKKEGFVDFAAEIRKHVNVPVIAAGRISPDAGERILSEGKADFVAMGRQLLADPATVQKISEGRRNQVRPCVYCYVCVAQPFFDEQVRCSVNPAAAKESRYAELLRTEAETKKRVVVIGGGPAGMEAACTAAARGHTVTLFEKHDQLGGTLRFAALPYEPNENLLDWFEARVASLPIDVRLGEEATVEKIRSLAPDQVIAGIGARREKSEIPGSNLGHVWDGDTLRDALAGKPAQDGPRMSLFGRVGVAIGRLLGITTDPNRLRRASKLYMPVGKRVAVIGGGLVGVELAEFFAERGREVCVLEKEPVLAVEMAHPRRWKVLHDLREAGVRLESRVDVTFISEGAVRFSKKTKEGLENHEFLADTVVIASGLIANDTGMEALGALDVPVRFVGDTQGVGYIEGAIRDGFEAAIDL